MIIDDFKGRKFAEKLGLKITGSLGIIVNAKLSGYTSSVKEILQKIKSTDFRINEELEKKILEKVNEL